MTPPLVPSFMSRNASTLSLVLVRHASASCWAAVGTQFGVYVEQTTFTCPLLISGSRHWFWPA